jgi:hypothetical protein
VEVKTHGSTNYAALGPQRPAFIARYLAGGAEISNIFG